MFNIIHKYEIEISSYCNRNCPWCSNKYFNRNFYKEMEEYMFIKILDELQRNVCNREDITITFSKFNEPTYNFELLKLRALQLKLFLPKVKLSINTNGDFLTKEILNLPINILGIMDYDGNGKDYGYELLENLGAQSIVEMNNKLHAIINGIDVKFFFNWRDTFYIEDRGNILNDPNLNWREFKQYRNMPCLIRNRPISIDYLGNVSPCCHIRADVQQHQEYIIGNIKNNTLQEIFNSSKFNAFNSIMEGNDNTLYYNPCRYCQKIKC